VRHLIGEMAIIGLTARLFVKMYKDYMERRP
jgi:hypothetical protein